MEFNRRTHTHKYIHEPKYKWKNLNKISIHVNILVVKTTIILQSVIIGETGQSFWTVPQYKVSKLFLKIALESTKISLKNKLQRGIKGLCVRNNFKAVRRKQRRISL